MPTYLDFDSSGDKSNTQKFRNDILGKTLSNPNGPKSFTKTTYSYQKLSDFPNVDPGDVVINDLTNRTQQLKQIAGKNQSKPDSYETYENLNDYPVKDAGDIYKNEYTSQEEQLKSDATLNIFKPEEYFIPEIIDHLPRRANLNLYPYFERSQDHTLISIMSTNNYDTESELFKFAATYIKKDTNGPVLARISQNMYTATFGRVNLLDALNGNAGMALDILSGKSPLVESNNKITTARTLMGKGIDFLQTVAGVEFPWTEIPGDYLTDPRKSQEGTLLKDIGNTLTSAIGIQRNVRKNPSDLFIEYMGEGQKQALFNNLSYSKYAPNYTTTARSGNQSGVLGFASNLAQGAKTLLGLEAPIGVSYIGDDRSDDVALATSDINDRYVRSPYHLSYKFDPIQAELFQKDKNTDEGGQIGGRLTWISSKSKNKLGANNKEYESDESSKFLESLSTKFTFKDGSILGATQEILETLPDNGTAMRSHVANVIDQTSRVFKEGAMTLSRGSAIKYVDKFTGEESGVEFCRVWTKDRSYFNNSDLMKRTGLIRKYDSSVLSTPYNLNIGPISNGNGSFEGSTNIVVGKNGFYAKKYMFSIENLAWKNSNTPGYTYDELPYCERGPNGGRVMWFPPYDLKVAEQNSAKWEENIFLGRPEPIYTYSNATRTGNISFKVIVDHPSILNLLVRDHFKNMSDEEADNYINAFFAGCEDLDFYALIRRYSTLSADDIGKITEYLNAGKPIPDIQIWTKEYPPVVKPNAPQPDTTTTPPSDDTTPPFAVTLYFENDIPGPDSDALIGENYEVLYNSYQKFMAGTEQHSVVDNHGHAHPIMRTYDEDLKHGLAHLFEPLTNTGWTENQKNDFFNLYSYSGDVKPNSSKIISLTGDTSWEIQEAYTDLVGNYTTYSEKAAQIKADLMAGKLKTCVIKLEASCSAVAETNYNLRLSYRRSYSIINDFLAKIAKDANTNPGFKWPNGTDPSRSSKQETINGSTLAPISFDSLGYKYPGEIKIELIKNNGEVGGISNAEKNVICGSKNFLTSDSLKRTAPLAFYCRNTTLYIESTSVLSQGDITPKPDETTIPPADGLYRSGEKIKLIPVPGSKGQKAAPPLDELKRIVMKTLGECYYFKKLEEDSPFVFNSLKEKFRYFHPAFHSMTPEGLNSRLTFLQQCLRPGDTLPIKGISDTSDMNARNTTFGPPPICILRLGDFYNSKVVIRDINIDFEDNLWDLNPEGIGVQPMIANVTLQVNFIGGHGMEKPVERLQNALSSNFYANTEVYDYRATATEDRTKFTKEELEKFPQQPTSVTKIPPNVSSSNVVKNDNMIGKLQNAGTSVKFGLLADFSLGYTALIKSAYSTTNTYFTAYKASLEKIASLYGNKIAAMFFAPEFRDTHDYIIQTGAGTETLELLGQGKTKPNLFIMSGYFTDILQEKIKATNISTMMGLALYDRYEPSLNTYIRSEVASIIDTFSTSSEVETIETARNNLISNFDKLNFIVKTGHDGYVKDGNVTSAFLTGFTDTDFYVKYKQCVDFIKANHYLFTQNLDSSFDFSNPTEPISDEQLSEFLSLLLDKDKIIKAVYDRELDSVKSKISKIIVKFLAPHTVTSITVPKTPILKDSNDVSFSFINNGYIFDEEDKQNLIKINSYKVNLSDTLNFYKNG